jgi:hypothetical protein
MDAISISRYLELAQRTSDSIEFHRLSDRAVSAEWSEAAILGIDSTRGSIMDFIGMANAERMAATRGLLESLGQQLTPAHEIWNSQCR